MMDDDRDFEKRYQDITRMISEVRVGDDGIIDDVMNLRHVLYDILNLLRDTYEAKNFQEEDPGRSASPEPVLLASGSA